MRVLLFNTTYLDVYRGETRNMLCMLFEQVRLEYKVAPFVRYSFVQLAFSSGDVSLGIE